MMPSHRLLCLLVPSALAALTPSALAGGAAIAADYFGAPPPGARAELFSPGIVSRADRFEARIAFSRDLRECYLTETDATFSKPRLLESHRTPAGWSDFASVAFGAKFKVCHEPFLSADDRKLYFTADGDATPGNARDFWLTERTGSGWGEPTRLPAPFNSEAVEFFFNQTANGTVVFASNRPGGLGDFDLYCVEKEADGRERAVNLGAPVNTPGPEYDPCISPDGRFLVFAGAARNGGNNLDLFVSFRPDGKTWTSPVPLPGNVNTAANEYGPSLSPDGRYLFFVRHDGKQSDIYWLATTELLEPLAGR